MSKMRAIRTWRGAEGRVCRGDEIEVDDARARELEGFIRENGRVLYPTNTGEQRTVRERRVSPRAVRLTGEEGETMYEDKGGATAAERGGHAVTEAVSAEPIDATGKAGEIAAAEGVPLSAVRGTGKAGRILEGDVRRHIRERDA